MLKRFWVAPSIPRLVWTDSNAMSNAVIAFGVAVAVLKWSSLSPTWVEVELVMVMKIRSFAVFLKQPWNDAPVARPSLTKFVPLNFVAWMIRTRPESKNLNS